MGKSDLTALGHCFREFRNRLGISQEKLAERCELHKNYIGQVERGERNPSFVNIVKLCNGLNIGLSEFFAVYEERKEDI